MLYHERGGQQVLGLKPKANNPILSLTAMLEEEEARMLRMASLGPDWEKGLISIITTALAAWYVVVVFRLHGEDFLSSFDLLSLIHI